MFSKAQVAAVHGNSNLFRSAEQCSDFEGNILKPKLSTGTAEEAWYPLCVRRISRAEYCIHFVLYGLAGQSIEFTTCSLCRWRFNRAKYAIDFLPHARPSKVGISSFQISDCSLAEQSMVLVWFRRFGKPRQVFRAFRFQLADFSLPNYKLLGESYI